MLQCLGGSLKPEGLGDGLKINSCLPRAQLLYEPHYLQPFVESKDSTIKRL